VKERVLTNRKHLCACDRRTTLDLSKAMEIRFKESFGGCAGEGVKTTQKAKATCRQNS
jgi:hypothetical protein